MNKPKVSIIIPVYNVEKYLRKCLDSVINQTEKDIEIIIVNDASFDKSEDIILEYANKDKRIIYIKHGKNSHVGGARNTGLERAVGEYVWFIDSDDWIDITAVGFFYNTAKKNDLDLLTFEFINISVESHKQLRGNKVYTNLIKTGKELFELKLADNNYYHNVWTLIVKNDLAKKHLFVPEVVHQDVDWTIKIYLEAKITMHICYIGYYYLVRKNSITDIVSNNDISYCFHHLELLNRIINYFISKSSDYQRYVELLIEYIYEYSYKRIEKNKNQEELKVEYNLFIENYENFTNKQFDLRKKIQNKLLEEIKGNIDKKLPTQDIKLLIKSIKKQYWERKIGEWTNVWIIFRDNLRGKKCQK